MLAGATAEAFTVSIDNLLGRGSEERLHHRAIRLFRGGQGYRYSGKIHEGVDQAIISRHGTAAIAHSDIQLLHYGYLPEIMLQKNKAARNEKLLRAAVAEHPEDERGGRPERAADGGAVVAAERDIRPGQRLRAERHRHQDTRDERAHNAEVERRTVPPGKKPPARLAGFVRNG